MQVRLKQSLIEAGVFYRAGSVMAVEQLPEFARGKKIYYEEVSEERPPSPSPQSPPQEPGGGEGSLQPKRLSRRG